MQENRSENYSLVFVAKKKTVNTIRRLLLLLLRTILDRLTARFLLTQKWALLFTVKTIKKVRWSGKWTPAKVGFTVV
jgi:hypothetical protein